MTLFSGVADINAEVPGPEPEENEEIPAALQEDIFQLEEEVDQNPDKIPQWATEPEESVLAEQPENESESGAFDQYIDADTTTATVYVQLRTPGWELGEFESEASDPYNVDHKYKPDPTRISEVEEIWNPITFVGIHLNPPPSPGSSFSNNPNIPSVAPDEPVSDSDDWDQDDKSRTGCKRKKASCKARNTNSKRGPTKKRQNSSAARAVKFLTNGQGPVDSFKGQKSSEKQLYETKYKNSSAARAVKSSVNGKQGKGHEEPFKMINHRQLKEMRKCYPNFHNVHALAMLHDVNRNYLGYVNQKDLNRELIRMELTSAEDKKLRETRRRIKNTNYALLSGKETKGELKARVNHLLQEIEQLRNQHNVHHPKCKLCDRGVPVYNFPSPASTAASEQSEHG